MTESYKEGDIKYFLFGTSISTYVYREARKAFEFIRIARATDLAPEHLTVLQMKQRMLAGRTMVIVRDGEIIK